jgi:hypothetical protein
MKKLFLKLKDTVISGIVLLDYTDLEKKFWMEIGHFQLSK